MALISPNQSIGLPRASTTLPSIASQTGTSRILPVFLPIIHSLIVENQLRITTPTKFSSKLSATQVAPLSNSTSSL